MFLLEKDTLSTVVILIFKVLIDSYISPNKFLLVNNVLRKYIEMKHILRIKDKE